MSQIVIRISIIKIAFHKSSPLIGFLLNNFYVLEIVCVIINVILIWKVCFSENKSMLLNQLFNLKKALVGINQVTPVRNLRHRRFLTITFK